MSEKDKAVCPRCGKPVEPDSKATPFCSERCRLIDLGAWLNGKYRIKGRDGEAQEQQEEGEPNE